MNGRQQATTSRLAGLAGAVLAMAVLDVSTLAQELPPSHFPLDTGNSWLYRIRGIEELDPEEISHDIETWRVEVLSREGAVSTVRYVYRYIAFPEPILTQELVLWERPDGVDLLGEQVTSSCRSEDPPPGEFVSHYRIDAESFVHRSWNRCLDGAPLPAMPLDAVFETPAGAFEGCVRFDFPPRCCSDYARLPETWCPGAGLVEFGDNLGGTAIWFSLSELDYASFQRGDATGDGAVELSDAILVLNYLFLGAPPPGCLDAADADDGGTVGITDAILVLSVVFLGTGRIAPPASGACGYDPVPDGLVRCEYHACP